MGMGIRSGMGHVGMGIGRGIGLGRGIGRFGRFDHFGRFGRFGFRGGWPWWNNWWGGNWWGGWGGICPYWNCVNLGYSPQYCASICGW
jgi:hypothetical protein